MLALLKKEINSFLNSLTGYLVIIVFLIINGLFLWVLPTQYNIPDFGFANIDNLFMLSPFVFLFLIPAITMRSFADEQKSGTIEMLLTKPLSDMEIIGAKYLAALALVLFALLPTLVYFFSVHSLGLPPGNLDMGGMWGSYLGLLFLGGGFVAIGIFASSLAENQIVAFIIAVFLCGFLFLGFEFIYSLAMFGKIDLFIQSLGINAHYASMSRGVIDSRDVLYFCSLIAIFLLFTKIKLESRKW